jgi:hypothetical protein
LAEWDLRREAILGQRARLKGILDSLLDALKRALDPFYLLLKKGLYVE